jgi:hypothetical protein
LLAAGCALLASACIASSVVESSGRAVAPASVELDWRPARGEDLRGLFESVSIEGEAAASLWRVLYVFAEDGSYSGAALVLGAGNPEFQTLSGRWALVGDDLDLGDGQTVRASVAADHLKLESAGGIAILRRVAVQ